MSIERMRIKQPILKGGRVIGEKCRVIWGRVFNGAAGMLGIVEYDDDGSPMRGLLVLPEGAIEYRKPASFNRQTGRLELSGREAASA